MTSYFSVMFLLVMLPIIMLIYGVAPRSMRPLVLLGASYVFVGLLSKWLILFLMVTTLSVYLCACAMGALYARRDRKLRRQGCDARSVRVCYGRAARVALLATVVLNLGILVALKYLGFLGSLVAEVTKPWGLEMPAWRLSIGAPIGISFYTLMAISYLADVYRETTPADANLVHVALYLCFFPQIMEGPLTRYGQTIEALTRGDSLTADNTYAGLLRIAMGCVKKLLVADRLNPLVATVFGDYVLYDGGIILVASILYTVQLYCDFSGTMDVALGLGRIFGVSLPENFAQPCFSKSTSEFWQRWHITLGAWFKDYVYYPISLSKPCKTLTTLLRKRFGRQIGPLLSSSVALFCVWMGNGIWHGAGSQYLLFGMYYFVLIFAGSLIEAIVRQTAFARRIDRTRGPYALMRILRTLAFVVVGELIFRASSATAAIEMVRTLFCEFTTESLACGALFELGVDAPDLVVVCTAMAAITLLDILKERGMPVWESMLARGPLMRWMAVSMLLLLVVVFGAYGHGYVPVDPLYAQF